MQLFSLVPYGYRLLEDRLEPIEAQQVVIRNVREQWAQGQSLQAIQANISAKLPLSEIRRICKEGARYPDR